MPVVVAAQVSCPPRRLVALGDERWVALVEAFDASSVELVSRHGGAVMEHVGSSLVALLDSPSAGAALARALLAAAPGPGVEVRVAVHEGAARQTSRGATGVAVQVVRQVLAAAGAGEALLTDPVRAAVPGAPVRAAGRRRVEAPDGPLRLWLLLPAAAPRSAGPPRAVVVDDHPLWRHTMTKVLDRSGAVRVVGEAADAEGAAALLRDHAPELVLLDLNLAGSHGLQVLDDVAAGHGGVRVLVLSSSDEPRDVLAARRAGAAGYLLKTADARDVVEAVRRVLAGDQVFPEGLEAEPDGDSVSALLTPRQLEVLSVLADGRMTSAAAARRLGMSPRTLSKHLENAYSALGVSSRLEALDRLRAERLIG